MLQHFKFEYCCEDRLDGTAQSITVKTSEAELENTVVVFKNFLLAAGFSQSSITKAFSIATLVND